MLKNEQRFDNNDNTFNHKWIQKKISMTYNSQSKNVNTGSLKEETTNEHLAHEHSSHGSRWQA